MEHGHRRESWRHYCEFCKLKFPNEKEAVEHESKCYMKPNFVAGKIEFLGNVSEGFKFGFGFGLGILVLVILSFIIATSLGFSLLKLFLGN